MSEKIQILSSTGKVLFEHETEDNTIKKTVVEANLRGANLREADLREADLYGVASHLNTPKFEHSPRL